MNVFELVGKIVIDSEGAKDEIDETTKTAEKAHSNLSKNLLKIGGAVVGTTVAIGTALYNVAEETREYRTQMGQLTTAFTTQNHSAKAAKQTYQALVGVLGDSGQATEAALHIAKLARSEEDLNTWTNICTGVFATFGASLPIEGLTESANETAKVGQVTGSLADALNWAGISEDKFNRQLRKCRTEQQRQDLIMNTLIGTYGDASRQYQETNKDVIASNIAHDNLNSAMAGLGAAAEPAVAALVNAVADIATAVTPIVAAACEWVGNLINTWRNAKEHLTPIKTSITVGFNTISKTVNDLQTDPAGTIEKAVEGGEVLQNYMKDGLKNRFKDALKTLGWNAKGAVFKRATIFDTRMGLQGVGEAGPEAVAPISVLQNYVSDAVNKSNGQTVELLAKILEALQERESNMEEKLVKAFSSMRFDVNNREFARLVKAVT